MYNDLKKSDREMLSLKLGSFQIEKNTFSLFQFFNILKQAWII
jgi:hypothetical protein